MEGLCSSAGARGLFVVLVPEVEDAAFVEDGVMSPVMPLDQIFVSCARKQHSFHKVQTLCDESTAVNPHIDSSFRREIDLVLGRLLDTYPPKQIDPPSINP